MIAAVLPFKPCQKCKNRVKHVHLTLFTMGEIFIIFLYFRIFAIFYKYMKNKIGILENGIYIFPIVNSVICVHSFDTVYRVALRTLAIGTQALAGNIL